jgi:hypothetical protein
MFYHLVDKGGWRVSYWPRRWFFTVYLFSCKYAYLCCSTIFFVFYNCDSLPIFGVHMKDLKL